MAAARRLSLEICIDVLRSKVRKEINSSRVCNKGLEGVWCLVIGGARWLPWLITSTLFIG